jgi:hypothetical protein
MVSSLDPHTRSRQNCWSSLSPALWRLFQVLFLLAQQRSRAALNLARSSRLATGLQDIFGGPGKVAHRINIRVSFLLGGKGSMGGERGDA